MCVSALATAAHSASELVKICQAKSIRAVDYDGVGIGDVHTAFDDGRANENICLSVDETVHDTLQKLAIHLTVAHDDSCSGAKSADQICGALNG
jgi:hypothetical protein